MNYIDKTTDKALDDLKYIRFSISILQRDNCEMKAKIESLEKENAELKKANNELKANS